MTAPRLVTQKFTLAVFAVLSVISLSGCIYQVPITADPTRGVEERLLGEWASKDGKNKLKVRRLDDSHYIVSVNGYLFALIILTLASLPLPAYKRLIRRNASTPT